MKAQIQRWKYINYALGSATIGLGVYNYLIWHPHDRHGPQASYMNIRTKKFPWKDGDTALFDVKKEEGDHDHHDAHH